MANNEQESQFNWSLGLGLGAILGVLVSAIVGLLRLSKPKEPELSPQEDAEASNIRLPEAQSAGLSAAKVENPQAEKHDLAVSAADAAEVQAGSTHWRTGTKYVVAVLLFLALLGLLYISSQSLSTIIFAALLTFLVHPIVKFFQRRFKMRRGWATMITYLLVLGLLVLLPFLIVPSIIQAINFFTEIDYLALIGSVGDWVQLQANALARLPLVGTSLSSSLTDLASMLNDIAVQNPQSSGPALDLSFQNIGGQISQTLEFLGNVFGPLISFFTRIVFILLISLHMSLSIDFLREGTKKLIPPAYQAEITALIRRLILIWQAFLRGQMSLMLVIGVIVWIGNLLLGTPQALLLGVLAGLLELIPNLGPILATIPAVLLALFFGSANLPVDNWIFALIIIAFYVLVQMLENQFLVPYILGDAVDLPPLIVIIGVLVGGSAFGLLGVFLATPVISSGREVFMYLYNKILEPPPEPEVVEDKPSMVEAVRAWASRALPSRWRRRDAASPALLSDEAVGVE
jgi:predicted PurR-regulated permease PerM